MSYKKVINNWEGFAKEDALWSILTDPNKKNNQWNESDFFKTGQQEISFIIDYLQSNNWLQHNKIAIDFGCGVGRLSRAMTTYFNQVIGIDASETMIRKATLMNSHLETQLSFKINQAEHLDLIENNSISFIYSSIVLQHLPKQQALQFIAEFIKKLEIDGIAVFQVPTKDIRKKSMLAKIKATLKVGETLSKLGLIKKYHMEMNVQEVDAIESIVHQHNSKILIHAYTNHTLPAFNGKIEFIEQLESVDYESSIFIIKKSKD